MLDAIVQNAATAAQKFYAMPGPETAALLEDALTVLIQHTATAEATAKLSHDSLPLSELLSYCPIFLAANYTSSSVRTRLHHLLFNLSWHNMALRELLAGELQICSAVFQCLKVSLREQLGPQNLIDTLRLLQVLTYGRNVELGVWANDLISFLLGEICRSVEPEWMPFCMGILCNLANRSKAVCLRIKKSSSYKAFCQKILTLLSHDSRIVVISGLVLVGYLEEQLRETVYCSQNVPQTFQCVFNVLITGDNFMARHIAADLLKRLVLSEPTSVSSTPVITATGNDLVNYPYFDRSLQQVASLLVTLDRRSEESYKVYDLLLAFCSLPQLRTKTAAAVLRAGPAEQRLTTPVLAVCQTALLSFDDALIPETPLKAVRLLQYVLKEAIESGSRVQDFVPPETILQLVEGNIKTSIETSSPLVSAQCRRITEGLRLAEVVSQDDELRTDMLDVASAHLCAHIAESQMISNPVVVYMNRPPGARTPLPDWSAHGVEIVLQLLRLLASLKDYCKNHKDQYWKLLKDERLVPFLAFAISCGRSDIVHGALEVFVHCSQVHRFPSSWLGDLVASATTGNKMAASGSSSLQRNDADVGVGLMDENGHSTSPDLRNGGESVRHIDELIAKMKEGMNIKDPKISQLISVFDRKIASLEAKERELEEMVRVKEHALSQSERLRSQYRSQGPAEGDLPQFRDVVADLELKTEKALAETTLVKRERDTMSERLARLQTAIDEKQRLLDDTKLEYSARLAELQRERMNLAKLLETQKSENDQEREMHQVLRRHYDDMKQKFEAASGSLFDKEEEARKLLEQLNNKQSEISRQADVIQRVETALANKEEEFSKVESKELKSRAEIRRLETESASQLKQISELKRDIDRLRADNQKYAKLKEQLGKMASEY
uniref:Protein CIP2A n=1 Tax=Plectus sambesii TaxID=2011161 RepID=A0A914VHU2_9BILA